MRRLPCGNRVHSVLPADYGIFVAESVVRAVVKGTLHKFKHFVLVQRHFAGVTFVFVVVCKICTVLTVCFSFFHSFKPPFNGIIALKKFNVNTAAKKAGFC